MEFVNTTNDLNNEVKIKTPQSSKCRTIIIKNMIWQGKITYNFNNPLTEKWIKIVAFEKRWAAVKDTNLHWKISIGIY